MNLPKDLKYTKDHIWLDIDGNEATVGLTDYAQEELGEILFVDLPEMGGVYAAGDIFCEIESSKTAQALSLPFGFTVFEQNEELYDSPELLNEDAYANCIANIIIVGDAEGLLSWEEYEALISEE